MLANTTLVTKHWLKSLPTGVAGVATQLPDSSRLKDWASQGYITIDGVVGGSSDPHTTRRDAVVSISCYSVAVDIDGNPKPTRPFTRAAEISEIVIRETIKLGYGNTSREVALPAGYEEAFIIEVYPLTEPRLVPGDTGYFAIYQMDINIIWASQVPVS